MIGTEPQLTKDAGIPLKDLFIAGHAMDRWEGVAVQTLPLPSLFVLLSSQARQPMKCINYLMFPLSNLPVCTQCFCMPTVICMNVYVQIIVLGFPQ